MTDHDSMRAIYLFLLLAALGIPFLISQRHRIGQTLQYAAIWGFVFLGAFLVYADRDSIMNTLSPTQRVTTAEGMSAIEVPLGRDGHYHMVLDINGAPVRFVVDTGASDMVLTREDAARAGIDLDGLRFLGRAFTANGPVATADVRLDEVRLGDQVDRNVRAVVNDGEMFQSLLGMSYLSEFGRIEIEDGRLRLIR
ncbi:retropepsin-like aspartic protease family protein [Jannaschia aquimarina]|uniref:Uncharacterized protein n=1 Tax=Jannaschia aquimarina TaxID=935700 RepID=A0A0D1DDL1_9RHOB|nr:TIGR02281 family clan AA aspartic protease [Jannaschia aquimarina]KIT18083.1 hypothetical protein jaqu_02080 [Jannaschia aquimarina]SNS90030.1 aspartyl protease family protein [Jannaschia aquimarina]